MRFTFSKKDNGLVISHNDKPLLEDIYLTVSTQRDGCCDLYPEAVLTENDQAEISFVGDERIEHARLLLTRIGDVLQFRMDIATVRDQQRVNYYFTSNDAIRMHFRFARSIDGSFITDASTKLWFQTPSFSRDLTDLPKQTQDIHLCSDGSHVHILPLVCDDLRTEFKGDALVASVGCCGVSRVSGYVMTLSVKDDPYEAISENFEVGRKSGAIEVPLRRERVLPPMFKRFGWCTWDAFYQQPTSEKIYKKLDEFKALGIKLGYLLIDDGWSLTKDMRLWDICEDREKFPEGLAGCIARIKNEYGVPYVGVWQAFNGYWKGIALDGPIASELGDTLMHCPNGLIIPSPDPEKNFSFWDRWHSYLAAQGVDFVKVDNQTTYSYYIDEMCKNVEGVRGAHEGLERSVFKHFDGRLINCMGMGIYDQLTRRRSALNRNSNDFLPKLENGFVIHCMSNIYNAPVHSQLMWCDYDMWWSRHESSKASSVLRAISGGPVYISDGLEQTDLTYLQYVYEENGDLPLLDEHAMPTYDCFYSNCAQSGVPQKAFNRCGENFAVAAFGLSEPIAHGTLRLSDIPGADNDRYIACEFFSREKQVLDRSGVISFSLGKYDVRLWNLYPIHDGVALIGSDKIYMGCADKNKTKYHVCDIC